MLFLSEASADVERTQLRDFEFDPTLKGQFYSEYIYQTRQKRLVFDVEASGIDSSQWHSDGKSGFWFAFGFGLISDNDKHYDLMMCEYRYTGKGDEESEAKCFDRHWDNDEVYENDAY